MRGIVGAAAWHRICANMPCLCHLFVGLVLPLLVPRVSAQLELNYLLDEEVQSGTFVGNVFRDINLSSLYSPEALSVIYLRFLKENVSNFTITNRTGIIRTHGRLDREAVCPNMPECNIRLDVAIQPVQYLKIIKVTLDIRDRNDNPPRFVRPVISHSILESAIPGSGPGFVIPPPIDLDSPAFSVTRYELQPRDSPFKLSIASKVDDSQEIQLILNRSLDREKQDHYTFQLVAYDGGSPPNYGTVELQITVLDANDNHPAFAQPSYEVTIPENVSRNTTVIEVVATDLDIGENGAVSYGFSETTQNNYGHLFGINENTGEVYVKSAIDYELSHVYHLSIVAQDRGPDSIPGDTIVVVHVTDVNDNAPSISINTLSQRQDSWAEVYENSPVDTFVAHVTVEDRDSGPNGKFNCSLNNAHFKLQYLYDSEYKILTRALLDREEQEVYKISVTCKDRGINPLVTVKTLTIKVRDVNDHPPQFDQHNYSGELIENSYQGAYVTRVNATDADLGVNAEISYSLPGDMRRYFSIDPSSGVIRARTAIDREVMDEMRFYVVATDHGEPPLSSSALVIVEIQDVNDQAPIFPKDEYTFAVYENEPEGTPVGQVLADDADGLLYNTVTYKFLPSHNTNAFRIDEATGQISTASVLDREVQFVYYLEVLAQDKGSSRSLSSSTSVTVYVNDRNDNAPIFDYPSESNNTIYLSNQVPKGYVITKITAHDVDLGQNAKIVYDIESGNRDGMFHIDGMHGTLVVKEDLSHILSKMYELRIVARDSGDEMNMAFSNLNLVVNRSVPFPLAESQRGTLIGHNFTIVISVACVSALIIVVLVVAIVCLKRQDADRQARKYNCRMQALRMMSKDGDNPKASGDAPWDRAANQTKCNGTTPVDHSQIDITDVTDQQRFTSIPLCLPDTSLKTQQKIPNKDGQPKIWPTSTNSGNAQVSLS
ncbi:hypothetical protein LSH36_12g30009 [Paralvinella palmiformis]|uniref:Cadherin domain-containing protein n=1 Tax=Paralvinella palmiformis TaxID=53620 RepID=A0AAD9NJ82_9ANNE|nr:hypothetical protein LSH36_12g30009 [Paralvinella palmiformis]